jgi:hypothetical protein
MMNDKQKVSLVIVIVVVAVMLLFPPFNFTSMNGIIFNLGYGFIFDPPTLENPSGSPLTGAVDIGVLITQWIGVLVIGGITFFMLKNKN